MVRDGAGGDSPFERDGAGWDVAGPRDWPARERAAPEGTPVGMTKAFAARQATAATSAAIIVESFMSLPYSVVLSCTLCSVDFRVSQGAAVVR